MSALICLSPHTWGLRLTLSSDVLTPPVAPLKGSLGTPIKKYQCRHYSQLLLSKTDNISSSVKKQKQIYLKTLRNVPL